MRLLVRLLRLSFLLPALVWAEGNSSLSGIEGMRSQEWSVGIFIFLVVCILVFTGIVLKFMTNSKTSGLKTGEKIMFAWILLGIVAALVFGALQLLHGQLF